VVSPGNWLLSSDWFLLSTVLAIIERWGKSASLCRVIRAVVVFTRQQLHYSPSKVGQFSFECCFCPTRSVLESTTYPSLGGWVVSLPPLSAFVPLLTSDGCYQLLWEVGLTPHSWAQSLLLYPWSFTESSVLRVWFLAPTLLFGTGAAFHPHLHCQC
jgi:hypothetical protein